MKTKRTLNIVVPNAPLKRGDRSLGVMYLQIALQAAAGRGQGKPDIVKTENGWFGPETELRLRKFQERNKIHIDGRYTDLTRRVLREVLKCK